MATDLSDSVSSYEIAKLSLSPGDVILLRGNFRRYEDVKAISQHFRDALGDDRKIIAIARDIDVCVITKAQADAIEGKTE